MQDAIERLELGVIIAALAARVRTPLGTKAAHALSPLESIGEARDRIEAVRQARGLLERGEPPPVEGAEDVGASLELGAKGVRLDGLQLRAIASTMHTADKLRRYLFARETDAPALYGIGATMEDFGSVPDEVSRCFTPDGQLADEASPDLGQLRQRLRSLHAKIREVLGELLRSPAIRPHLQEEYYTVRADRYVLPIKISSKNEVPGIVHDASGSGQTAFIEPQAIVDLGNRLKIAQSDVIEEEHRILDELTGLVVEVADSVIVAMEAITAIDLIVAAGRLAGDLQASAIVPDERPGFDLIKARHPQLLLQQMEQQSSGRAATAVVANDIGLRDEQRVLVLTGPNTGGKTVAMKTVGLLALMVRCGLHVPCDEGSRLGWFEGICAAIGDQQSIAANMSTFAAHLKEIVSILDAATERTLVLLDEIAADTDPSQGQALAQAILEKFADRGCHTIVTTHFERLKAIPFADPRFRNAGVGFDPEKMRPTYRVVLDMPQGSSGIDIAQTLGLSSEIVTRARGLTGESGQAIDALMKSLQSKTVELDAAKDEAERAYARLVQSRNELERAKASLEREKQLVVERAREELVAEIAASRNEVRTIIAKLQKAAGSDAVREAMRQATDAAARMAKLEADERDRLAGREREAAQPRQVGELHPGDWVHVAKIQKDGEVVAIEGDEVVVAVGNMRTRVPKSSLSPAQGKRPKHATRRDAQQLRRTLSEVKAGKPVSPGDKSLELDLRGSTTEEALDRLDAFLDSHYQGSAPHVRIIHGHGTGALKTAIRGHLKRSGYVKSFRPGEDGEGGDGVTVIELS